MKFKRWIWVCLLAIGLSASDTLVAHESDSNRIRLLATYKNVGLVLSEVVGPGPTADRERFYQSYAYIGRTLEVVSIDPDSGEHEVFESPVKSEYAGWAMINGGDGKVYVGTSPGAYILSLDPHRKSLVNLGRPSQTEQYIWQFALGADNKIYGCTYPSAKLIRFDPLKGLSEDLGSMDTREQYARSIAASKDGFVYIGIGMSTAHLVAYEISTGLHKDILPSQYQAAGVASVYPGDDGKIYGQAGKQTFELEGWRMTPVAPSSPNHKKLDNRLQDGRVVSQGAKDTLRLRDSAGNNERIQPFHYAGKEMNIFRLGLGPDGFLYGSTALPLHFFRVNLITNTVETLGEFGKGEFYSLLSYNGRLLGAAYSGKAPLMVYDPNKPFLLTDNEAMANPLSITYEGRTEGWRPMALIVGSDKKIYIGALAGYGQLGGPLTVWDPSINSVETFRHVVQNQSVVSLAESQGLIIGATSIFGGGGSRPTESEAKLFAWDPILKRKLFEIVPVNGAKEISDLIAASNGLIYGIAGNKTLFSFELKSRKILCTKTLPFQLNATIYNSIAIRPNQQIWGLVTEGVFKIDPVKNTVDLIRTPAPITAGFVLENSSLYYASGPNIYLYEIPGG